MAFMQDNKETVLAIINGWRDKLTYELLSQALQKELGLSRPPSRHTYSKYGEIETAIKLKKQELREKKSQAVEEAISLFEKPDSLISFLDNLGSDDATIAELVKCIDKIDKENKRLTSENNSLKKQVNTLLETFARWEYNLQRMDGVDLSQLQKNINEGLPEKNRN